MLSGQNINIVFKFCFQAADGYEEERERRETWTERIETRFVGEEWTDGQEKEKK